MNLVKYSAIAGFFVFAAAVSAFLAQMWFHPWEAVFYGKLTHTCGALIAAVFVAGFLARESGASKGKAVARRDVVRVTSALCFVLFVAGVLTYLAQLWCEPWGGATYDKIMLTEGALFALAFGINFLVRESRLSDSINNGDKME